MADKVPLVGPSNEQRASDVSQQKTVNWYPEISEYGTKEKVYLYQTPGTTKWVAVTDDTSNAVRGIHEANSRVFFVVADKLYVASNSGDTTTASNIGTLNTVSGDVDMAHNFDTVAIVDGSEAVYGYNFSNSSFSVTNTWATVVDISDAGTYYGWSLSNSANTEYFCVVKADNTSPSFELPAEVKFDSNAATKGTVSSLANGEWGWGDADSLGFNTVYVNLADGADPDAKASGYVQSACLKLDITPTSIDYMDGYLICNNGNSANISAVTQADTLRDYYAYVSDSDTLDFKYDSTRIISVDREPDAIKTVKADHGELFFFKDQSTDVYYDSGGTSVTPPFEPIRGAAVPWGILGGNTVAPVRETLVFMTRRRNGQAAVVMMEGFTPKIISTSDIEYALQAMDNSDLDAATAYSYIDEGHEFYVLTIPNNRTFVFDAVTGVWHERTSFDGTNQIRHRGKKYAFLKGEHIVTDYEHGALLKLDLDVYTDDDNGTTRAIKRVRRSTHIHANDLQTFHHRLHVDMQTGSGAGTLMVRWSDDEGTSWATTNVSLTNDASQIVELFRLGQTRDRVYELSSEDAMAMAIVGGYIELTKGYRS